jgi:RNA polymerase sigma-70 factor (ECF subfamily)
MASGTPGPYQIQAAIAALHANAPSSADTDWQEIVVLYQSLRRFVDTPVVRLNQAVAVAMASDAASGLRLVDSIEGLERYSYFHAARGTLLAEQGRDDDAREAFLTAIDLTTSPPERRLLESKLAALG